MKKFVLFNLILLVDYASSTYISKFIIKAPTNEMLQSHILLLNNFAKQQKINFELDIDNHIDVNSDKKYYNDAYWKMYTISKQLEAGVHNMLDKNLSIDDCKKQALSKLKYLSEKYTINSLLTVPTVSNSVSLLSDYYQTKDDLLTRFNKIKQK